LDEIEGYQKLISPARRIPINIIQEIFIHTLPTTHNALMGPDECPVLLTRICPIKSAPLVHHPHSYSHNLWIPHSPVGTYKLLKISGRNKNLQVCLQMLIQELCNSHRELVGKVWSVSTKHLSLRVRSTRFLYPEGAPWDRNRLLSPILKPVEGFGPGRAFPSLSRIAELAESDVPLLETRVTSRSARIV
jgi:hypothetical protein